jgi:PhoPQ-activated pathogenicity-related protein
MTKSAVRAMDTVTALCKDLSKQPVKIDSFVVSGMSKRGWTTWLTAAADTRVVAIAPQVIDLLNMEPSMEHHRNAYGEYSAAVTPYVENGIMNAMHTPEAAASRDIIDPYSYRKELTIPKLIINSTGDQFFLPDSSRFYYNQLLAPKYLRYIPNTSHGLNRTVNQTLLSFYASILNGSPLPECIWTTNKSGNMVVTTKVRPIEVKLWQADNRGARDFRELTIGKVWKSKVLHSLKSQSNRYQYEVVVERPESGWRAYFAEVIFPDVASGKISLTTEVTVIPDTLPHIKAGADS